MGIKSLETLVKEVLDLVKTILLKEALNLSKNNQCNLIDIRDIRELQNEGRAKNSSHIPKGMLELWPDPKSVYFKDSKLDMKKNVFFCAGVLDLH